MTDLATSGPTFPSTQTTGTRKAPKEVAREDPESPDHEKRLRTTELQEHYGSKLITSDR